VCEVGLAQHPAYLSARVTLGRALFELGRLDEARAEFLRVLDSAPDNLVAIGKLAEIHQRTQPIAPPGNQEPSAQLVERSPDRSPQQSADALVLAELEAWLEAIARRRSASSH